MSAPLDDYSRRWNTRLNFVWGVTAAISNVISQLELGRPALLPNLQREPTLLLFSDYSGQHKQSKYEAFSFLLTDFKTCRLWDELRTEIRKRVLKDDRRISFKGMNDGRKRSVLIPFLNAANSIPGLIMTILINKGYSARFHLSHEERNQLPTSLQSWPLNVIRKLTWISHFGALVFAGLSASRQNLLWFTDEDEIAANAGRVTAVTSLAAGIISRYVPHDLGHFRFGTASCDNGDLFIEDFAAIPDLVAGALAECCQRRSVSSNLSLKLANETSAKTRVILAWVAEDTQPLRRISLSIDPGDKEGKVKVRALDFMLE